MQDGVSEQLKQHVDQLRRDLHRWLEPHIIERGVEYYQDGRVSDWSAQGKLICARVQGFDEYQVEINLDDFTASECDCPYEDYCKHMAAVVYEVAAQVGVHSIPKHDDVDEDEDESVIDAGFSVPNQALIASLSELTPTQLLKIIELAMNDDEQWGVQLGKWYRRWRGNSSVYDEIAGMSIPQAAEYFEAKVQDVMSAAEREFILEKWEEREHDRWDDDYGLDVWDFSEGVKEILAWCEALTNAAGRADNPGRDSSCGGEEMPLESTNGTTDSLPALMPALVGLSLTEMSVAKWLHKYADENTYYLRHAESQCINSMEYVANLLCKRVAVEPALRESALQFTDWIIDQCTTLDELLTRTTSLSAIILDADHLRYLRDRITGKGTNFGQNDHPSESQANVSAQMHPQLRHNQGGWFFVDWWCEQCIRFDAIEEAEVALRPIVDAIENGMGPLVRKETLLRISDYYSLHGESFKAVKYAEFTMKVELHPSASELEWLSKTYENAGFMDDAIRIREEALLRDPTWDRFCACLADIDVHVDVSTKLDNGPAESASPSHESRLGETITPAADFDAARRQKVAGWARNTASRGRGGLAYRMLWLVGEKEEAWDLFCASKHSPRDLPSDVALFLREFSEYKPKRCIAVYKGFVTTCIEDKHRRAYQDAAQWMKTLRGVWEKTGQWTEWDRYVDEILLTYRRYPALMSEIRLAGLVSGGRAVRG